MTQINTRIRINTQREKKTPRRFSSILRSLAHACSGFGAYFTNLQRRCFESGGGDCEGGPTIDEARKDYSVMNRSGKRVLPSQTVR